MIQKAAHYYLRRGAPFQLTMIAAFIVRRLLFYPKNYLILVGILTAIGLVIFSYCLYVLYIRKNAQQQLITTGVFKYTRHPMYTALVLMDSSAWFGSVTWQWGITTLAFYSTLLIAAWWQEQEVKARFGPAGEEYLKQTPRLFIWYPLQRF